MNLRLIPILLVFILAGLSGTELFAQSPSLYEVRVDGKYGLINAKGELVLKPTYERIQYIGGSPYREIVKKGKFGRLDTDGTMLIPAEYDAIHPLDPDAYLLFKGGKNGLFVLGSRKIIPATFDKIQPKDNVINLYPVIKDRKTGLLSLTDGLVVAVEYDEILVVNAQIIHVRKGKSWQMVNLETGEYSKFLFENIRSYNGKALVKIDHRWYFLDDNNEPAGKGYDTLSLGVNNYLVFYQDGKAGALDTDSGEEVIPAQYDEMNFFFNGLIRFRNKTWWGIRNLEGKILVPARWEKVELSGEDFFIVQLNGVYGVVDTEGKQVIPLRYDFITREGTGFFTAVSGDNEIRVTTRGKVLPSNLFDNIGPFNESVAVIEKRNRFGVINAAGEVIIPVKFRRISMLEGGIAKIYSDTSSFIRTFKNGEIETRKRFIIIPGKDNGDEGNDSTTTGRNSTNSQNWARANWEKYLEFAAGFGWFYSDSLKRWGMVRPGTQDTLIKPILSSIDIREKQGYTLVFRYVNGLDIIGIMDHTIPRWIAKPVYRSIAVTDFALGRFARAQDLRGQYLLIGRNGRMIRSRRIAYIGTFRNGFACINLAGRPKFTNQETMYSVDSKTRQGKKQWMEIEGGKWGVIDRNGKMVMKPTYEWLSDFDGKVFIAKKEGLFGLVESTFAEISEFKFSTLEKLRKDPHLILGSLEEKRFGYMNVFGELVIPAQYTLARPFSEGMAAVMMDGKWGYINTSGKLVIPCEFSVVNPFSNGLALVRDGRFYNFLRKDGSRLLEKGLARAYPFSEGLARVVENSRYGFIDIDGNWVVNPELPDADDFENGCALVRTSRGYGLLNDSGNWAVEAKWDEIVEWGSDYAVVRKKRDYGVVDFQGNTLVPVKYDKVVPGSDGLYAVKKRYKYGYLNREGDWVLKPQYTEVGGFHEGLAPVREGSLWGYINPAGEWAVQPRFRAAEAFKDGYAKVREGNGWFLMRPDTTLVNSEGYSRIGEIRERLAIFQKTDGAFGVMDMEGNFRVQPLFMGIEKIENNLVYAFSEDSWKILDIEGTSLLMRKISTKPEFSNGLSPIIPEEMVGLFSPEGKEILPPEYDEIKPLHDVYRVHQAGKMGYLDLEGNWIWRPTR